MPRPQWASDRGPQGASPSMCSGRKQGLEAALTRPRRRTLRHWTAAIHTHTGRVVDAFFKASRSLCAPGRTGSQALAVKLQKAHYATALGRCADAKKTRARCSR